MRTYTSILGVVIFVVRFAHSASVMGISPSDSTGDRPRGEMIRNGSFEEAHTRDDWHSVPGGVYSPKRLSGESRFVFGEESWGDYEFSFTFRVLTPQDNDASSVLIGVRHDRNGQYTLALAVADNEGHVLERVTRNPRTRRQEATIVQSVPGTVQFTAYRVRIRCEGRRLRAWLNDKWHYTPSFPGKEDQLLFDFTDKEGPTSGRVSVGMRAGQAWFLGFKVTSLDGKVLFEGGPAPARHWYPIGNSIGEVWLSGIRPLHGKTSLVIATDYGGMGVEQHRFRLRKGNTCRGSLWMRGDGDVIVVRLVDGKKVLAEQRLEWPPDEWKEFPLELAPNDDAANASLQILTTGGTAVYLDQVSLLPDSAKATAGPDSNLP